VALVGNSFRLDRNGCGAGTEALVVWSGRGVCEEYDAPSDDAEEEDGGGDLLGMVNLLLSIGFGGSVDMVNQSHYFCFRSVGKRERVLSLCYGNKKRNAMKQVSECFHIVHKHEPINSVQHHAQ